MDEEIDSDLASGPEDCEEAAAKLAVSVQRLDDRPNPRKFQRSEIGGEATELGFARKNKDKVRTLDLLAPLKQSSRHGVLKKLTKRLSRKVATKPDEISKTEQAKLERKAGYSKVVEEVTAWDAVVETNRVADEIFYPLQQPTERLDTMAETKMRPVTQLERDVLGLLDDLPQTKLTRREQYQLRHAKLSDLKEQWTTLQRTRLRASEEASKNKRQNKIKSKSYHRLQRRERNKAERKRLEGLEKTDPEEYALLVEKMAKSRAEERMSQRHRGGKFAGRMAKLAKHERAARDAVEEMTQLGRKLRERAPAGEESEDSEEEVEEAVLSKEETVLDVVADAGHNPWMAPALTKTAAAKVKPVIRPSAVLAVEEEGEDEEVLIEAEELVESTLRIQTQEQVNKFSAAGPDVAPTSAVRRTPAEHSVSGEKRRRREKGQKVADGLEELEVAQLRDLPTGDETRDSLRMDLREAFASDDVVAEFREEKKQVAAAEQPGDVDLSLPGWGDWAGAGIKTNTKALRRKRARFTIRAPEVVRRDKDMADVIIREAKDTSVARHQVNSVPFPFTSAVQFENSIRHPLGPEWNAATSHRILTAPKVHTKLGAIIEPITRETTKRRSVVS